MISLNINNRELQIECDPATPLLWVLREHLHLCATRFGCGMAQCGACTVHIDGQPVRACVSPVETLAGKKIITLEGLSGPLAEAVMQAWQKWQVPQCGYCQSGQIMSAVALLKSTPHPQEADINNAMSGNICRCGTYTRIKKAIRTAAHTAEKNTQAS